MPITGLPNFLISSAEFRLDNKTVDAGKLPVFVKGRVVSAKVLQLVSPRQALLQIGGKQVLAKTLAPLKPGQEIMLQATRTGTQPVLRLVGREGHALPETFSGLVKAWGRMGPFGHLSLFLKRPEAAVATDLPAATDRGAQLRQLIAAIALKSGETAPDFLNQLIQGCGLVWEKKLASFLAAETDVGNDAISNLVDKDIKALCLRLLQTFSDAKGIVPESLKAFVDGLENMQLFNKYGEEESGKYLLPLPTMMQDELTFGQLLLNLGGGGKTEKEEHTTVKISFLLTLTRLGDLRADFSILDRAVSGVFGVATENIRDFILPHLDGLKNKLQIHGYDVRDITCRVVGKDALAETALFDQAIEGAHNGVLNVVI